MTRKKRTRLSTDRRRFQKRQSKSKRSLLASSWVVLLLLGVGVGALLLWHYLGRTWRGNERYSLVLVSDTTDNVAMATLDPINSEMLVVFLPSEVLIDSVSGYGEYRIGALPGLGEIEGIDDTLTQKSVQELFGLYMSGVIHTDQTLEFDKADSASESWLADVSVQVVRSGVMAKLPLFDAARYYREVRRVRADKLQLVSLESARLLAEEQLRDGSKAFRVDTIRLDQFLQTTLEQVALQSEEVGVAVVNTTGTAGLGSRVVRSLANSGVDVVAVDDSDEQLQITKILVSQEKIMDSSTLHLLRLLFPSAVYEIGDTERFRAEVVVFLGNDYRQFIDGDSL